MCATAIGLDLRDQRLQLVEAAPRDAGGITLARETAGDGAAGGITRADDESGFLQSGHFYSL
jgi:hypothetical protein